MKQRKKEQKARQEIALAVDRRDANIMADLAVEQEIQKQISDYEPTALIPTRRRHEIKAYIGLYNTRNWMAH